jgi:NhaA family Na+:H+ antiporter
MNSTQDPNVTPPPPEAWLPARRLAQSVAQPLERFMHIQASSGLVLLATAIVALVWANSPWHQSYEALWHTPFTIGLGEWVFERDLHFWINDFLMAVFFLVVGLEIKRELAEGALSEWKRAALPMAAALGGMVVPALLYFSLNTSGPSQSGWGVPMATDIAFAVGILTLLGKRVPATLRVLLLAIAIVDDIGAIIVIAVFYSAGIDLSALAWVGGGILGLFVLHAIGIRPGFIYAIPGIVLWAGMLKLGVHPTIAGVIIGFMTPVKPWFGKEGFLTEARTALDDFQARVSRHDHDDELLKPLGKLARARREALSPAKRIEANLHPYVAFGIMPLFALANAGVNVGGVELGETTSMAVFLGTRLGLCSLPDGVRWSGLFVVGAAGGIGFTMAIFIGELAFTEALLPVAKIGVLFGTLAASLLALAGGLVFLRPEREVDAAMVTLSDAEGCTDYWTTDEQPVQDKM